MPKDPRERARQALINHRKMEVPRDEAVRRTSDVFENVSRDYIEKLADRVYGKEEKAEPAPETNRKEPEMEAAKEEHKEKIKEKIEKAETWEELQEAQQKVRKWGLQGGRNLTGDEEQELYKMIQEKQAEERLPPSDKDSGEGKGEETEEDESKWNWYCDNCEEIHDDWTYDPDKEVWECNKCGEFARSTERLEELTAKANKKEEEKERASSEFGEALRSRVASIAFMFIAVLIIAIVLPMIGFGGMAYALTMLGIIGLVFDRIFPKTLPWGYAKPGFRVFGFIFLTGGLLAFVGDRAVFRMIPMIVAAIGIFTFPSKPSADREEERQLERIMMIMRFIYGAFVLIPLFNWTFVWGSGIWSTNWKLGLSLLSLSLAFFIVIPKFRDYGEGKPGEIAKGFKEAADGFIEAVNKGPPGILKTSLIFFIIIGVILAIIISPRWILPVVAGFIGIIFLYKAFGSGQAGTAFSGITGLIGLFVGAYALMGTTVAAVLYIGIVLMGLSTAVPIPEARPVMGMIVLPIAIMAATTAYPQVMGEAVFGDWWPTVHNRIQVIESAASPMLTGFQDIQMTMGQGWTCLQSPQACMEIWRPDTEAEKSYTAVEVTNPEPVGLPGNRIEEPIKTDQGFDEEGIFTYTFDLKNTLTREDVDEPPTVENVNLTPRTIYDTSEKTWSPDGPVLNTIGSSWEFGPPCEDASGHTESDDDEESYRAYWDSQPCKVDLRPGQSHTFTVTHTAFEENAKPGEYMTYGIDAAYDVHTYADLEVEIYSEDRYDQLRDTDFYEPTSRFEWGPLAVGLGVGTQQPVKDGETRTLFFPVTNRGEGYLRDITIKNITIDGEPVESNDGKECGKVIEKDINNRLETIESLQAHEHETGEKLGLEPDETIDARCVVDGEQHLDIDGAPDQTKNLMTEVEYRYQFSRTSTVEVRYECIPGHDEYGDSRCKDSFEEDYKCDGDVYRCVPEDGDEDDGGGGGG